LEDICIPASVTNLWESCFKNCTSLKNVSFAKNSQLAYIGGFSGCSSLESINIPASVTALRGNCFENCTSLKNVSFDGNSQLTCIGKSVFSGCSSLESIDIPAGVTNLWDCCFSGCSSLESINIPAGVTNLYNGCFERCTNLKDVLFERNSRLACIDDFVFQDCSSLTSIDIPASVTNLSLNCFNGCNSLKSIDIPVSVKQVRNDSFDGCIDVVHFKPDVDCLSNFARNTFAAGDPSTSNPEMSGVHISPETREFCESSVFSESPGDSKTIFIPDGMEISRYKDHWKLTGVPSNHMIMIKVKKNKTNTFLIPNYRQITSIGLDTGILYFSYNG
jgi:hypothetical protein